MTDKYLKLERVFDRDSDEATIFIHGYMGAKDEESRGRIRQSIQQAKPPGVSLLLDWRAGDAHWGGTYAAVRTGYRIGRWTKMFNPVGLLIDGTATVGISYGQFLFYKSRARQIGRNFWKRVGTTWFKRWSRINLVGHSLGTLVIYHAIVDHSFRPVDIGDCVLLGSCLEVKSPDWRTFHDRTEGTIHNVYSKSDRILEWLHPGMAKLAGRHPIDELKRIKNHGDEQLGHNEYWKVMPQRLAKWWKSPGRTD